METVGGTQGPIDVWLYRVGELHFTLSTRGNIGGYLSAFVVRTLPRIMYAWAREGSAVSWRGILVHGGLDPIFPELAVWIIGGNAATEWLGWPQLENPHP